MHSLWWYGTGVCKESGERGFRMAVKGLSPVLEWPSASSGAELAATWIGLIIYGTKRPNIGNLPKRLKTYP